MHRTAQEEWLQGGGKSAETGLNNGVHVPCRRAYSVLLFRQNRTAWLTSETEKGKTTQKWRDRFFRGFFQRIYSSCERPMWLHRGTGKSPRQICNSTCPTGPNVYNLIRLAPKRKQRRLCGTSGGPIALHFYFFFSGPLPFFCMKHQPRYRRRAPTQPVARFENFAPLLLTAGLLLSPSAQADEGGENVYKLALERCRSCYRRTTKPLDLFLLDAPLLSTAGFEEQCSSLLLSWAFRHWS